MLDDGLLLQVLELLPPDALGRLAVASRVLYCFANHEDLWKALVIEVRAPGQAQQRAGNGAGGHGVRNDPSVLW